jgi:hypothetical protein
MTGAGHHDLLQIDVFDKLRDVEWFIDALSLEYRSIARCYGCVVVMSRERLIQAYDIFWEDAAGGKAKNLPAGTVSLDQYKLSSYLCFWLRRINPVQSVRPLLSLGDRDLWLESGDRLPKNCENFILYGNEIAALTLAIRIVQYMHLVALSGKNDNVLPFFAVKQIDQDTLIQYGKILKHKNISSHALYMAFEMLCGIGQSIDRIDLEDED